MNFESNFLRNREGAIDANIEFREIEMFLMAAHRPAIKNCSRPEGNKITNLKTEKQHGQSWKHDISPRCVC